MKTFVVYRTHVYAFVQFCTALVKPAFTVVTSNPVDCRFSKDRPERLGWRLSFLANVAYPFRTCSIGGTVGLGRIIGTFSRNEAAFNSFSSPASYHSFPSRSSSGWCFLGVLSVISDPKELDLKLRPPSDLRRSLSRRSFVVLCLRVLLSIFFLVVARRYCFRFI